MIHTLRRLAFAACICHIVGGDTPARAQNMTGTSDADAALRVFLDCRTRHCDFDYFRREITFMNTVRDRRDAQVHTLVTTRRSSVGTEFTIEFIGQRTFEAMDDTLQFFSSRTDTDDEIRTRLTQMLRLGLVRYAARTRLAEQLELSHQPVSSAPTTGDALNDPWNLWIFRINVGGNMSGEQRQSFFSSNASFSANRTSEKSKIALSASLWYSEDEFEFSDGSRFLNVSRSYGLSAFMAWNLGAHWAIGVSGGARTSTFRNLDLAARIGPLLQYNIFPYSESTRRALTFTYRTQAEYFDYEEITIFDRTTEFKPNQELEVEYDTERPWGSIRGRLELFSFIPDFDRHRIELSGRVSLRVVRGLNLNLNGSVSRTKDQIHLPRAGATDEEVLVRRRELGTDYRYWMGASLSYTFGSIYNTIVNPIFD